MKFKRYSVRRDNHISVGHSALHLTIAKMITIFISLLSSMLLSRFRTVEEYGTYSQLTIAITLATSLFMLGLPNSINYFLAKANNAEERRDFLSVYYSLNTILGVVLGVVLVLLVPLIEIYFDNETIRTFWYFLAIYPWANVTISSISNVLVVYERTKLLMIVNVVTTLVAFLSVVVIQLLGLSFKEYITLFLIGNIVIAIWIYVMVSRLEKGFSIQLSGALIRQIFVYSIPIGLASLVGTINIEMDKLMIGRMLGTESLAYYTNAGKELPLTIVATSLTAVLMPQIVKKLKKGDNEGVVSLWGISIELSYIVISFFVTACVVFAPQIITILYSEKYLPGVAIFRIYSLVLLLRTTYFGLVLNSIGKTKFILYSSVASLFINIVLNCFMYWLIGFEGPAVASFVSIFVVNFVQLWLTSRVLSIPFRKIFPWLQLIKISTINIIWGVIASIILFFLKIGTNSQSLVIAIVIGCIFAGGYLLFLRKKIKHAWKMLNNN